MGRTTERRRRNPRGQGARLRQELLDAAVRLLDGGVRDDELSLRAVAAEAGVAAPSIYAHFRDREDMLTGIVQTLFTELEQRLVTAAGGHDDPRLGLRAMCVAYCAYASDHPAHYRALFARNWHPSPDVAPLDFPGWSTFMVLQDAVARCVSAGVEPTLVSVRIWSGLHGIASLRLNMPRFGWPALDGEIDALVAAFGCGVTRPRNGPSPGSTLA